MEDPNKVLELIKLCLIPKLSKNYEDSEDHVEFEIRNKKIDKYFCELVIRLKHVNLKDPNAENIIFLIYILYQELLTTYSWSNANNVRLAHEIKYYFEEVHDIGVHKIIASNKVFDHERIFYKCMEYLHSKLTSSCFKKYPALIDVYHTMVTNIKVCEVSVVPSKVFPASLHLIDDYLIENKVKGLQCCESILNCLNEEHFQEGNYYEVIYLTLKKAMSNKNMKVTKLVFDCLTELFDNLPTVVKHNKLDDIYAIVLDELYVESNLKRKAECLQFTRMIISIHKLHCANSSTFQTIIADNLDLCCNEAAGEILLGVTIETLKEWLKYCWCVWDFYIGQKVLSNLLKILYCCKDDSILPDIQGLIITLIFLCSEEEREKILVNFLNTEDHLNDFVRNQLSKIIQEIVI